MTNGLSLFVDQLVPDDPFPLDWHDVQLRSRQMQLTSDAALPPSRQRRKRFARRSAMIAVGATLFIIAPLTALAVRLVLDSPPVGHPVVISDPLVIRLMPGAGGAAGSMRLAIAGKQRTVQIVLTADFQLTHPHRRGLHPHPFGLALGGVPIPPPAHVAISIRHFPATGQARRWPIVHRLQLPTGTDGQNRITLHVRLMKEAIEVEVRFGSPPTKSMLAWANATLAGISHD